MRSHHWISAPRRAERDRLRADLALPPVLAEVSAHQNLRGPYTAVGTMLRQIGPDIIRERPELAHRHRVELQETTPNWPTWYRRYPACWRSPGVSRPR